MINNNKKNMYSSKSKNKLAIIGKTKYNKKFDNFCLINKEDFDKTFNGYKNTTLDVKIVNKLYKEFNIKNLYEDFYIYLIDYFKSECNLKKCKKKWIQCKKDCLKKSKLILQKELESTIYYLNLLGSSFISTNNNNKLVLHYDKKPLTGKWIDDYKHFRLSKKQFANGKLIMGFGPSASGKTYWAKNIIKLLSKHKELEFPKDFLSIDGGIQRENSVTYQILKNTIKETKAAGVSNLVSASFLQNKSIFSSNKIKKIVKHYLKEQNKLNIFPNLYVPETLGGCAVTFKKCAYKYKDYIKITKDEKWIGIYIWQHKEECILPKEFKCNSVVKSGINREIDEGKKYSSNAYKTSEFYGNKELFRKSGKIPHSAHQIRVHNTGGTFTMKNKTKIYNKSILELDKDLYDYFSNNKKDIEKEFNCIIIPIIYTKEPISEVQLLSEVFH